MPFLLAERARYNYARSNGRPRPLLLERCKHDGNGGLRRPSSGLLARLGVPVGVR